MSLHTIKKTGTNSAHLAPLSESANGDSELGLENIGDVNGSYEALENELFFKITHSHLLPEFFTYVVSAQNHWMFITSRGALTAGRKNSASALFPYYSADKIIDIAGSTGPKTIIREISDDVAPQIWEPFSRQVYSGFETRQNLYKNLTGNKLVFEEINETLQLAFRYSWTFSNRFGFIRRCTLTNLANIGRSFELLDGLDNILPAGVDPMFQMKFSNLCDAYKKNELLAPTQLGIYYQSSIPTDRAEPNEGLRATTVWSRGLSDCQILLCSDQVASFWKNGQVKTETDIRGRRGAYILATQIQLNPAQHQNWTVVAELNQDQTDVSNLNDWLQNTPDVDQQLDVDIQNCQQELAQIISSSDGFQCGSELRQTHRHQSNVLFNVMRGGIPVDGYHIPKSDFLNHVRLFNQACFDRNQEFLDLLEETILRHDLVTRILAKNDPDLVRIGLEYLPLTYSRRHGDPTRPWNEFSIDVFESDGRRRLHYQGNWRDIFQNWEALSISYPEFAPAMVFRFLNASTADGHNPYRITKDGFEWEISDPHDPWSNIGYWGDHQIIYLCRLLDMVRRFEPSETDRWLQERCFAYANVPYRIRDCDSIFLDACETIDFDFELDTLIAERVKEIGSDGKLLIDASGDICRVTMLEKLLVPILAKLTNFVPEGGIWLNTQRPEWNDANNALVGSGLSVVTTCDLRRYLVFLRNWISETDVAELQISEEVVNLFEKHLAVLRENAFALDGAISDQVRRQIVNQLSRAGSAYRENLYANGFSGTQSSISSEHFLELLDTSIAYLDHTIRANRRPDGLYHSYNLIEFESDQARIRRLHEMLEGQVSVLNSGVLSAAEAADLLDALRQSAMYREDQESYLLYPDRELPRFVEKNQVSSAPVMASPLLKCLLEDHDESIIRRDVAGNFHFNGDIRNSAVLASRLQELANDSRYAEMVQNESISLRQLFESTFNHREFTGRSGTFFAYEGLGSIYWHMVSKLRLAVAEYLVRETKPAAAPENELVISRLRHQYDEINRGIGALKSPQQYGAIPTEPYSHTPRHAGAQQPGMTGQVKEDILARFAELGIRIESGVISFEPALFDRAEFLRQPTTLRFFDANRNWDEIQLDKNQFGFTLCQVPIVFTQSSEPKLRIQSVDDTSVRDALTLSKEESRQLFSRSGTIQKIEVQFP